MLVKRVISERDTCIKFLTSAPEQDIWNKYCHVLRKAFFTDEKIYIKSKLVACGKARRADYNRRFLYHQLIAINCTVEAIAKGQDCIVVGNQQSLIRISSRAAPLAGRGHEAHPVSGRPTPGPPA